MITIQLRINGDRDETYRVELPAVPRVGENLIYTLPPSRDVWHRRTFLWTVAKVIHIPAQRSRPVSITVVLTDGVTVMDNDDYDDD